MARSYGLTRKITRKQALAYERTVPNRAVASPNGIGVTAIAAVMNAPSWARRSARAAGGSYAQRYSRTQQLLRGSTASHGAARKESRSMKRRRKKGARRVARRARANRPPMVGSRAYSSGWERIFAQPIPKAKPAKRRAKKKAAAGKKHRRGKLPKLGRTYGRFKSLTATIGGRKHATFLYGGRGGRSRKIPLYALLGAKSRSDLNRRVADDPRLARRVVAAKKRRDRAASRLLAHGDAFTPNKSRMTVIPYESWSKNMEPNRRRHRRRKAKANRRHHRKHRRMHSNPIRTIRGKRRRVKLVSWRKRPRVGRGKRRAVRRALHKRFGGTWFEANKKHRRKGRKRHRYVHNEAGAMTVATPNRRHGRRRHHGFRHFRRNPDYSDQLKGALTVGGIVLGGFVLHRLGSSLVNGALSKVQALQTPTLGPWQKLLGIGLTAAVGIPLAFKFGGSYGGQLAAGMGVSALLAAVVKLADVAGQPQALSFLSGYPDDPGRAYGEYFMTPGYGDFGEYFMTPGYGGFGAAPMITQAAAGYGYGAAPMITQAAAGYGAPVGAPAITQAAAGVGEYFMTGITGIGDYENVPAAGASPAPYEGIMPDLASAERALTIAEAAAGVGDIPQVSIQPQWAMAGLGDLPFQSTVEPTGVAVPVHDAPHGSRAGILEGRDGIFG